MPRHITMKFSPWGRKRVLDGRKRCTSRRRVCGLPKDTFIVEDKTFMITKVEPRRMLDIIKGLYREEGSESPSDLEEVFKQVWRTPVLDYDLILHVHWFEEVK